jgi:hypothetical protein
MSTGSLIRTIVAVALVLSALAYGTRQAIAGSRTTTCLYDPPAFLGDCPGSDEECEDLCQGYGQDWHGYCTGPMGTGCCVCFL